MKERNFGELAVHRAFLIPAGDLDRFFFLSANI